MIFLRKKIGTAIYALEAQDLLINSGSDRIRKEVIPDFIINTYCPSFEDMDPERLAEFQALAEQISNEEGPIALVTERIEIPFLDWIVSHSVIGFVVLKERTFTYGNNGIKKDYLAFTYIMNGKDLPDPGEMNYACDTMKIALGGNSLGEELYEVGPAKPLQPA